MNAITKPQEAEGAQVVSRVGIATALVAAQKEMGRAIKDSKNPHFRSMYADLGNVMDACMPALNERGIALIQPTGRDEYGDYVETILIHGETGESVSCRVPLIVQKNDMQGYGSAVTYARRYGLMAMAGVAPEDDDGNAAAKAAPKPQLQAPKVDEQAIQHAVSAMENADTLDALAAIWKGLPLDVQTNPKALKAKDTRKAELTPQEQKQPVQIDDEIPH